jgi:hypothetical protein
VAEEWRSGAYLVRLTASEGGKQAYVPFVVREGPAPRATLLFPLAVSTWQAYNNWGGKSLYDFNSDGGARALRVSFDRPYGSGAGAWAGLGAGELLTVAHTRRRAGWEYPMIRWLEREGYDVAYATNLDVHADSSLLLGRRGVIVAGHDEYWSRAIRDRMEAARDAGIGLAFLGGNIGYWQIRVEPSAAGLPGRVIYCAKDHTLDPTYDTAADRDLTVHFRHLHPRRPENALLGVMMAMGEESVEGDFIPAPDAKRVWVYRGTGVARGATASLPGLVGHEADRSYAGDPLYGAWSPPGLLVLARSPVVLRDGRADVSEATVYAAPSGSFVFSAGTVQWAWGLDDWGAPALRPALAHPDAQRITRNVLEEFFRGAASSRGGRSPR